MLFSRLLLLVGWMAAVVAIGCVSGCSSSTKLKHKARRSAQEMFTAAMALLNAKKYSKAADEFDAIESEYPHSDLAAQSQLLAGYCLIKAKKYPVVVDTMDMFMEMHPTSPWVKQALYLRALAYYLNTKGLQKDPQQAKMALESFNQCLERFPHDALATDVRAKKQFLKEHVASHDMMIGRYYLSKNNYVAAWHHYHDMLQDWPDSVLVPEIYYRIIECHVALGLAQRAQPTLSMLKTHAPTSPWTKRACSLLGSVASDQSAKPTPLQSGPSQQGARPKTPVTPGQL